MPHKEKKIIWSQHSSFWEIYALAAVAILKSGWSLVDWQEDRMFCSKWQWENVAQSELWMCCSVSRWSAGNEEPRDDYAELLRVALVAVSKGDFIPGGVHFSPPGAYHCARWMAKRLYCLKMLCFREQFPMNAHELQAMKFVYNNAICQGLVHSTSGIWCNIQWLESTAAAGDVAWSW